MPFVELLNLIGCRGSMEGIFSITNINTSSSQKL